MKLIAMIGSRSRSERFPGKAIAELAGVPMIGRIVQRARLVKGFDEIILSTTGLKEDDRLAEMATEYGASRVFRGPETNLLARRAQCLRATGATHFVHFSGDSPFIDVKACEFFIQSFLAMNDPEIDILAPISYYANVGASPYGGNVTATRKVELDEAFFARHPEVNINLESYWSSEATPEYQKEVVPLIRAEYIDFDQFVPREKTPIKTSIDYPLEMAFWNKVIELYGHYPENIDEIYEAFRTIKEL